MFIDGEQSSYQTIEMSEYIYVMSNVLFVTREGNQVRKYGYTTNPQERIQHANTQTPMPHTYEYLWRIDYIPETCADIACHDEVITVVLNSNHHGYNVTRYEGGGGTEFFIGEPTELFSILTDFGYHLTSISLEEIEMIKKVSKPSPKKTPIKDILGLDDIQHHQDITKNDINSDNTIKSVNPKWDTRDYQLQAIEYAWNKIKSHKNIYIELATGGGKSFIVFNILKRLMSEIIIILSPRRIVNQQNVKSSYVDILKGPCHIYNFSDESKSFNEFYKQKGIKIIVACTQSVDKVHKLIVDNNMQNVSIWFDEAHWGLEEWLTAGIQEPRRLILEDSSRISYRIFTSASPDRKVIQNNTSTFGELYRPIKVSDLIKQEWLSPIVPYVFCEYKNEADVLYYMFEHFKQHNKQWGFSFHHSQLNASSMFYEHYKRYKEGITTIKPFLLVSDNTLLEDLMTLEEQTKHTNLKTFEGTNYSIAYVVAKYSMGYDFHKIDMVCFSDYKMSSKDIIQSIGRGTRPDGLGLEGRNKNKQLDVLLPVFPNSDDVDKYYRIAEVLAYLVGEVEIPLEKIVFTYKNKQNETIQKDNELLNYTGIDLVRSKVFEATKFILNRNKKITYKYIKELNRTLNLKSRDEYLESETHHQCFIKDPEAQFKQEWVSWYDFIGLDTSQFLQTKDEFITYCKKSNITSCDDYNIHYTSNKNKTLPQDPFQMYPNFTNWDDELKEDDDEFIW